MKKEQKKSDSFWTDEAGIQIPYNRTSATERFREKQAHKIASEARKIQQSLIDIKAMVKKASQEVLERSVADHKGDKKDRKGNFTWFNFDRTIKIEVSINERIDFDETLIMLCKEELDAFIKESLSGVDAFVHELINDAFQNTKGALDSKKVLSLLKHRTKIKSTRFHRAMELLEQSIRRPDSKTYFRIWEKNDEGKYENIDLNFSSI